MIRIKLLGFTLLELIVDIAILSILLVLLFLLIDPVNQISKAKDATKKHDLFELQTALDTYYNDTGCYPTSIPFGSEWKIGNTVYMKEVPQESSCRSNPATCYMYQVDTSDSCPQWNIVFVKQEKSYPSSCSLASLSSGCTPPNYDPRFACVVSGNVDCSFVTANPVMPPSSLSGDGDEYPSNPTSTPTPGQACPQNQRNYACTGGPARCNVVPAGTGTYCSSNCDGVC